MEKAECPGINGKTNKASPFRQGVFPGIPRRGEFWFAIILKCMVLIKLDFCYQIWNRV